MSPRRAYYAVVLRIRYLERRFWLREHRHTSIRIAQLQCGLARARDPAHEIDVELRHLRGIEHVLSRLDAAISRALLRSAL